MTYLRPGATRSYPEPANGEDRRENLLESTKAVAKLLVEQIPWPTGEARAHHRTGADACREGAALDCRGSLCCKGLYSSHNDGNYYELAYCLRRQFGESGLYRSAGLLAFADNHDMDRVASRLNRQMERAGG